MSKVLLPPLTPPLWTQEQAIAFEAACECVGAVISIYTDRIEKEKRKAEPEAQELAALRSARDRLAEERTTLRLQDEASIARIRAEYGAIVRAWNADHHSIAA